MVRGSKQTGVCPVLAKLQEVPKSTSMCSACLSILKVVAPVPKEKAWALLMWMPQGP